ncbi:MAG: ABC transporter permease [Clostridia bacterium]|nr:ABC transporter permease [Clostridia bacterium]
MFSDLFYQLLDQNMFLTAAWETVYLTLISTAISYAIGVPLGLVLCVTDRDGIYPIVWLNKILSVTVNVFRSIPFIILMVAMFPVARFVVGTSVGNKALIFSLVVGAAPYVARMVESSVKEVNHGIIEAAQAMGTSNMGIITKVLIPEAKPSLIIGAVISTVTVLSYTAMAGTVGAGGLGRIAIAYGHQRFSPDITWVCMILTIIIVQVIQELGMLLARKTDKRIRNK